MIHDFERNTFDRRVEELVRTKRAKQRQQLRAGIWATLQLAIVFIALIFTMWVFFHYGIGVGS